MGLASGRRRPCPRAIAVGCAMLSHRWQLQVWQATQGKAHVAASPPTDAMICGRITLRRTKSINMASALALAHQAAQIPLHALHDAGQDRAGQDAALPHLVQQPQCAQQA